MAFCLACRPGLIYVDLELPSVAWIMMRQGEHGHRPDIMLHEVIIKIHAESYIQVGQGTVSFYFEFYLPGKTAWGGQMKTFGFCSIDVQDSKNDFGMSAPPGEK